MIKRLTSQIRSAGLSNLTFRPSDRNVEHYPLHNNRDGTYTGTIPATREWANHTGKFELALFAGDSEFFAPFDFKNQPLVSGADQYTCFAAFVSCRHWVDMYVCVDSLVA